MILPTWLAYQISKAVAYDVDLVDWGAVLQPSFCRCLPLSCAERLEVEDYKQTPLAMEVLRY